MTKEQTNILKGIAILMMLFLHLFNGANLTDVCEPLLFIGSTPLVHIISKACNPVGIFLMLSGYGLSYTYFRGKLSFNGQEHRLLKLYIHYWIILLIFVSIGSFVRPEKYPGSLSDIIMNFTSISNSYNSETWFLFPYALLSLTSVWIFKCIDKLGCVKSIIITWILYMISCYITSRYIAVNKAYTEWYTYIITYFNVLFSFVIGAVFHRQVEKGKGSIPFLHSHKLTTFAILMTLIIINFFISSAATAYLFEFSYIFLLLHLTFNGITKRFLIAMGKQSMVMWLTHSFFCYHIFHDFIYGFRYPLVIYVALIIISYVVSIPISYIAKLIIQRIPLLR
ncbi:acyltransferase family protein [Prevotella melaninogenica]